MKRSIFIAIAVITLAACKNDIDVVKPDAKVVPIVYGIIDLHQDKQYLKIQKSYISEDNPQIFINNPEYIYYKPSEIEVYIEKYYGDIFLKKIIPHIDTLYTSSSNKQILYVIENEEIIENTENLKDIVLKLFVKDLQTNVIAEGHTKLLDKLKPNMQITNHTTYNLASSATKEVSWYKIENGAVYTPIFRTLYSEYDNNGNFIKQDSVDFNLGNYKSQATSELKAKFNTEAYFNNLAKQIKSDNNVKRKFENLKIIIVVAQQDFLDYIQINSPSDNLNQEKPNYTNVKNGLGIFTNRYTFSIDKQFDNKTLEELINGSITKSLRFY